MPGYPCSPPHLPPPVPAYLRRLSSPLPGSVPPLQVARSVLPAAPAQRAHGSQASPQPAAAVPEAATLPHSGSAGQPPQPAVSESARRERASPASAITIHCTPNPPVAHSEPPLEPPARMSRTPPGPPPRPRSSSPSTAQSLPVSGPDWRRSRQLAVFHAHTQSPQVAPSAPPSSRPSLPHSPAAPSAASGEAPIAHNPSSLPRPKGPPPSALMLSDALPIPYRTRAIPERTLSSSESVPADTPRAAGAIRSSHPQVATPVLD